MFRNGRKLPLARARPRGARARARCADVRAMGKEKKEKKEKKHKHKKQKKPKKEKKSSDSKKRKRSPSRESSSSSSGLSAAPAPPPASAPQPTFADLYPMPRRRAGSIASAGPIASMSATSSELQKRSERAERFLPSASDLALAAARAAAPPAHASTHGGALRGQSAMLEKSYMRLTTLPNAADVRPLPVLRQAFDLVKRKWEAERDYVYACDMLKSIRQDLTVQHLTQADGPRCAFAAHVYETHATIALQSGDLGEFGACQAALVPLHAARPSARAAEFGAYRLLHAAALRGASLAAELHGILSSLRPEAAADPAVTQALQLGVALQSDDEIRVLEVLPRLHGFGACLFTPQLPQLRERALHRLCRAYAPSVPLELLTRRLGWNGDERGCERFLRALGTVPARASGRPEAELDTRAALRTLGDRAAAARAAQLATVPTPEWEVGPAVPFDLLVGDW